MRGTGGTGGPGGVRFAKGHGTGNDFVILPDPDGGLTLTAGQVAAICDRRRGVGADGILRVVRTAHVPEVAALAPDAEWFMDYRNGDGSLAEMCGNGARVFARYLVDTGLAGPEPLPDGAAGGAEAAAGPVPGGSGTGAGAAVGVRFATRSGIVTAEIDGDAITVALPAPVLGAAGTARIGGREFPGTSATVGNPHLVCPVADPEELARLDLRDQPGLDPTAFPASANVEFVSPPAPGEPSLPGTAAHVRMRVYERGAGETLSCGSGTCAVAAVVLRRAARDAGTVVVDVPGGRLLVTIEPGSPVCRLTGPAVIVATGELTELAPAAVRHPGA